VLALPDAEHQGTAQAGADDQPGVTRADDRQAVRPFQLGEGPSHGLDQVAVQVVGNELGDDLGIGVAAEETPSSWSWRLSVA